MQQFIEVPANLQSLAQRGLVQGVGTNDSDYMVIRTDSDGNRTTCPFYQCWKGMLKRCYSDKYHAKHPTYKGCRVCIEWLTFSVFRSWMISQDWKGKDLDKDLLVQGNKLYSPGHCLFVSPQINSLVISSSARKRKYKRGVVAQKSTGKYIAVCRASGKGVYIGTFGTEQEAHEAYKEFKYKVIAEAATKEKEPLRSALLNYVIQ